MDIVRPANYDWLKAGMKVNLYWSDGFLEEVVNITRVVETIYEEVACIEIYDDIDEYPWRIYKGFGMFVLPLDPNLLKHSKRWK